MTPCSLSEAMRIGFQKNPHQTRGRIIADDGSICALGAGLLGIGKLEEYIDQLISPPFGRLAKSAATYLCETFPELDLVPSECPECHGRGSFFYVVGHLNDTHLWLPEQIISFVQSEEEKLGYVTLTLTEQVPCEYQPVQCESGCCV